MTPLSETLLKSGIGTSAPAIETMSPRVSEWLRRNRAVRVLSVFRHACNLIDDQSEVVALVAPQVGNGPFHGVLTEPVPFSALIEPGSTVRIQSGRIAADHIAIDFDDARPWAPTPDWMRLRAHRDLIVTPALHLASSLRQLRTASPPPSGLSRWGAMPNEVRAWHSAEATQMLSLAAASADAGACAASAAELAGLGPGSTPSGDDHLLGAIYAAWLIHPGTVAQTIASAIVEVAAPRTTSLSAACLSAAGRGECGAPWHQLMAALADDDDVALRAAASRILQTGATSGEEALLAFLGVFIAHAALERAT